MHNVNDSALAARAAAAQSKRVNGEFLADQKMIRETEMECSTLALYFRIIREHPELKLNS
ncbi:TPA: hypothetical protein ACP41M_001108 [Klebsiella aerogenes]